MTLYNRLLTFTLTLALIINGCLYMALHEPAAKPKPQIIHSACKNTGAFEVLASALQKPKGWGEMKATQDLPSHITIPEVT